MLGRLSGGKISYKIHFRTAEDEKHGDYLKITWCFYEDFVKSRVVVSSTMVSHVLSRTPLTGLSDRIMAHP
jgi:hypothetical protein